MSDANRDLGATQPEIKAGQIWREVDPRSERFVRVRYPCAGGRAIAIETVVPYLHAWIRKRGSRENEAATERFNGKRGGYALHEDAPA